VRHTRWIRQAIRGLLENGVPVDRALADVSRVVRESAQATGHQIGAARYGEGPAEHLSRICEQIDGVVFSEDGSAVLTATGQRVDVDSDEDDTPREMEFPADGDKTWSTHGGLSYPSGRSDEYKDALAVRSRQEADAANDRLQNILNENPDALADDLDEMATDETFQRLQG
jgi:hypothetical protein